MGGPTKLAQQRVVSALAALAAAALVFAVTVESAEAKKKAKPTEKPTEVIVDPANSEPLTLVISLGDQQIDVYRGLTLITRSKVSTGTRDYPTRTGVFSILEKRRRHHSNMYSGAPMPWMQRLTWSGTALHGGVVPGYPASHGCIRLTFSFAPKLFQLTAGGENVVIAGGRPSPRLIQHAALFQPTRPADGKEAKAETSPIMHSTLRSIASSEASSSEVNTPAADDAESLAPLRILVTRRTQRDRVISVQYLLASLGYLPPQKFSGRLGKATATAIKAFQKANGMPEVGAYTDDLAKKIYEVTGKEEPPEGHLFVRQNFQPVLDTPIALRSPNQPVGTHVMTAMFAPGDSNARWMAISLDGDDVSAALDRIEIPDDVRETISEKLTPGSSLIIGEESKDSAIVPDGGDFIVLAKYTPPVAEKPSAKVKQARAGKPKAKFSRKRKPTSPGYAYGFSQSFDSRGSTRSRLFNRWRWRR